MQSAGGRLGLFHNSTCEVVVANHRCSPASATTRRTREFDGPMSFVGPRPMIDEVIEELEPDDRIIRRKDRGSVRQSVELQLLQILGGIGGTHQHTRDRIAR